MTVNVIVPYRQYGYSLMCRKHTSKWQLYLSRPMDSRVSYGPEDSGLCGGGIEV